VIYQSKQIWPQCLAGAGSSGFLTRQRRNLTGARDGLSRDGKPKVIPSTTNIHILAAVTLSHTTLAHLYI
jgi:hypothetical protein